MEQSGQMCFLHLKKKNEDKNLKINFKKSLQQKNAKKVSKGSFFDKICIARAKKKEKMRPEGSAQNVGTLSTGIEGPQA
jgi:hypothetical protein